MANAFETAVALLYSQLLTAVHPSIKSRTGQAEAKIDFGWILAIQGC
jgi:hypothetical protein